MIEIFCLVKCHPADIPDKIPSFASYYINTPKQLFFHLYEGLHANEMNKVLSEGMVGEKVEERIISTLIPRFKDSKDENLIPEYISYKRQRVSNQIKDYLSRSDDSLKEGFKIESVDSYLEEGQIPSIRTICSILDNALQPKAISSISNQDFTKLIGWHEREQEQYPS